MEKHIKHRKTAISTNRLMVMGRFVFAVQKQFLFIFQSNTLVIIDIKYVTWQPFQN